MQEVLVEMVKDEVRHKLPDLVEPRGGCNENLAPAKGIVKRAESVKRALENRCNIRPLEEKKIQENSRHLIQTVSRLSDGDCSVTAFDTSKKGYRGEGRLVRHPQIKSQKSQNPDISFLSCEKASVGEDDICPEILVSVEELKKASGKFADDEKKEWRKSDGCSAFQTMHLSLCVTMFVCAERGRRGKRIPFSHHEIGSALKYTAAILDNHQPLRNCMIAGLSDGLVGVIMRTHRDLRTLTADKLPLAVQFSKPFQLLDIEDAKRYLSWLLNPLFSCYCDNCIPLDAGRVIRVGDGERTIHLQSQLFPQIVYVVQLDPLGNRQDDFEVETIKKSISECKNKLIFRKSQARAGATLDPSDFLGWSNAIQTLKAIQLRLHALENLQNHLDSGRFFFSFSRAAGRPKVESLDCEVSDQSSRNKKQRLMRGAP